MGGWDLFQALLSTLRRVADRHGVQVADVAMRAALDFPQVSGIIVGVRIGGWCGSLPSNGSDGGWSAGSGSGARWAWMMVWNMDGSPANVVKRLARR